MLIFNVIFKTGIYPKSWKESFTIPIYKSGDKTDTNNYRDEIYKTGINVMYIFINQRF
jgi:hypothetical protein